MLLVATAQARELKQIKYGSIPDVLLRQPELSIFLDAVMVRQRISLFGALLGCLWHRWFLLLLLLLLSPAQLRFKALCLTCLVKLCTSTNMSV
jgi:hypothetical protein